MAISSLGAGSGLDLGGILTSLMQVEQQPLLALQQKEASYQARISALGTLKSALSALQTSAQSLIPGTGQTLTEKYSTFKASVADPTLASASAHSGAVAGNYSLEITALASSHRLVSPDTLNIAGQSALTSGLEAGGTLTIELGKLSGVSYSADPARTLSIAISAGSSLEDVRDAINTTATDGRVAATIVNGAQGKQLVISSRDTGTDNAMRLSGISGLDFNPITSTGNLTQDPASGGQAAADASFKLNGISATSSTNTVADVLDGVTITLQKTNIGSATTLTVTRDSATAVTASLNGFIKAYNDAAGAMKNLGYYDASTKQAGTLQGDSALRGAQSIVRNLLLTQAGGVSPYQTLSDIGVELQKDGTLKLDSTKLNKALETDFSSVVAFANKIGSTFKDGLEGLVGSTGSLSSATESTNRLISDITKRREALNARLNQIEERYRKQFSALDSLVASLNQTSSWLTQQLANLPGAYSSKKG